MRLRDVEDVSKLTPAMQQYANLKKNNESSLLFFRMGDFYELFFDDAIITAKELNITLTKRGKVLNESIPMCGIPFHAANNYVPKLVKKGFEIAICEQTISPEEMSLKGMKGPLTREDTRIIKPGTLIKEKNLEFLWAPTNKTSLLTHIMSQHYSAPKVLNLWAQQIPTYLDSKINKFWP